MPTPKVGTWVFLLSVRTPEGRSGIQACATALELWIPGCRFAAPGMTSCGNRYATRSRLEADLHSPDAFDGEPVELPRHGEARRHQAAGRHDFPGIQGLALLTQMVR